MANEAPLPTFYGEKMAPTFTSSQFGNLGPSISCGKVGPINSPVDLQNFLQGKHSDGMEQNQAEPNESPNAFLRNQLRYEFMTPSDLSHNETVGPRDMMNAFVEVTSAHGIPHISFARGKFSAGVVFLFSGRTVAYRSPYKRPQSPYKRPQFPPKVDFGGPNYNL